MTTPLRLRRTLTTPALIVLLAVPALAQTRPISEKDLFDFVWVADPQISPDGSQVAFVRVTVNERQDTYDTQLWIAGADGSEPPRPITAGTRDLAPRWSPDARSLAFVRTPEPGGRPQIFVMPMRGGEPRAITDMPRGAANPEWAPDSRTIAFTSGTTDEDLARQERERRGEAKEATTGRETDVRVITHPVYRANGIAGTGFVDRSRPAHLWTVQVPGDGAARSSPRRVTSGEFAAANHRWSPDGTQIYFVSDRRREAYHLPFDTDLYAVPRQGGEPARVASIDGAISAYAVSADGRRIAFVGAESGTPERSYNQPDLWVVEVPRGSPRNITAGYDFHINGGLTGDQRAPRGSHPSGPIWSADGRSLYVRVGEQGDANLKRVDVASGRVGPVTTGAQEVVSYTADAAGRRIAFVRSTPTVVGDLYALNLLGDEPPRKLTSFNDALFGRLAMREPEEIRYSSFDGRPIQGWILHPPDFHPGRKYPLILQIHGGPHAAYGSTFTHEFQWMAADGYVVLYTNPRGSSNYGQEFGNIIQFAYPGDDYRDLMAGVDEVLGKGYVDVGRLGVTGGSGGGLLTNWTITQTTRFRAAVTQRDISDWTSFWYTADFTLFRPTWFRKPPFQDLEDFARRSPLTHVERIRTPLMFITGDEDWRTPASAGGEPLFRALKFLGQPTVMVRFPNEHHDLSRSGKPWHRVERLQHIVGWFDKWLMGKEIATYD